MIGGRPSVLVRPATHHPVVLAREGDLEGRVWVVVGESRAMLVVGEVRGMYLNRKQESRKCYATVIIVVVPHEPG